MLGQEGRNSANNFQRLHDASGLSYDEVAAAAGISKSTVHAVVTGLREPCVTIFAKLAKVYGAKLDDLILPPAESKRRRAS